MPVSYIHIQFINFGSVGVCATFNGGRGAGTDYCSFVFCSTQLQVAIMVVEYRYSTVDGPAV